MSKTKIYQFPVRPHLVREVGLVICGDYCEKKDRERLRGAERPLIKHLFRDLLPHLESGQNFSIVVAEAASYSNWLRQNTASGLIVQHRALRLHCPVTGDEYVQAFAVFLRLENGSEHVTVAAENWRFVPYFKPSKSGALN